MNLRIHKFLPRSYANGPGARAVVWVQGCTLGCPGCFNPETHAITGGSDITVETLAAEILALKNSIEGITISGGEPLQQREPVAQLLRRIRANSSLSAILLTGFMWDEILRLSGTSSSAPTGRMINPATFVGSAPTQARPSFFDDLDVLVAGRYDRTQHLAAGLRGSANKTLHLLTDRYGLEDFHTVPLGEVVIDADGTLISSGIDPLRL